MAGLTPVLVLLPGMDGTGTLFAPLLAALGPQVETVRISYPPQQALAYDQLEQLVLQALPRGRPYVLLGESFSGPIAISIAARQPEGLAALVLCCTFVASPRPWLRPLRWLARAASVKPLARLAASWLLLGRDGNRALRAMLAQALAPVSGDVLAQRLRAVLDVDVARQLAAVPVPIHYLQATRDMLVPRACLAAITQGAPHTITHRIAGPHCLLQAAPRASAAVLRGILAAVH